jgi:hypothetical protein
MTTENYYIYKNIKGVTVSGKSESLFLDLNVFKRALFLTNQNMDILKANAPDLFGILGMRNLSAFVGEMFVSAIVKSANGKLVKNPHQDGYPDLLLMTEEGKSLWEKLEKNSQDKSPFSRFETGGIEVKSTVGSVPTPEVFRKRGLRKPEIGDERIGFTTSYDWKAHHRETNNLIGIYWDFVNQKPVICGLFYSGSLIEDDWGRIIQPRKGGGRTTSVSIMARTGVYKMYEGWIAIINDSRYADFFNRYNRADLIEIH